MKPNPVTVIQRAAEEVKPLALKKMQQIAAEINQAPSGKKESRNTQALVITEDGTPVMVTQREYSAFDEAIEAAEGKHAGLRIDERVIADKDDEGIHAEMLAVAWWLLGHIKKPVKVAASQAICARCQAVLDALGIACGPKGGHKTQNWCHPYRNAGLVPPKGALRALPQKVTKNIEYAW